jgi:hypothetical protein
MAEPPAWTPKPADVLVMLSGNEKGLLLPCGCFEPQRGGLVRRAAAYERARGLAKASTAVSVGETLALYYPAQDDMKAELFRAALAAMEYGGSLLSAGDLAPAWPSLSQPYGSDPAQTPRPPLNVKVKSGGALAGSAGVDPILRLDAGGLRIRAVSVVDAGARDALLASGVADAVVAPESALQALPKEAGLLVVAAHVDREYLAMVRKAAQDRADLVVVIDVVAQVAYGKPVAGWTFREPLLVKFDDKGKEVGMLRLSKAGASWTADYEVVPLDPFLEEGESKAREAVRGLFAAYRQRAREAKLLEAFPSWADGAASFVGNDACAKCHAAIVESWQGTPHAYALPTLVDKDSAWDPECVRCHTVGWTMSSNFLPMRWTSSFQTPDATPKLGGVGCEACHGPGSRHVKEPRRKDLFGDWAAERLKGERMWRDFGRDGCFRCHDPENSAGFQKPKGYEEYRAIVDHRDVPKEKRTVEPK